MLNFAPILDAVIPVAGDVINKEFIISAKKLKIISAFSVGYDNIDIKTAAQYNIPVTNLPDIVTESTAELTFLIMLALSRRLLDCDNYIRYHNDYNWHPFLFLSNELFNKKLGIIGLGRIGKAVAIRAISFGMSVYYYDVNCLDNLSFNATFLPFENLLKEVDYLTLHIPYSKATHHMIGANEFKLMKNSTYFVNASRGSVVDQEALIKALKEGQIKGAALDVFETEPQVPEELIKLKNVVLTPHVGTNTIETNYKMALEASRKIIQVFNGQTPTNIVNI
ncbi:MAG: 2-hydroxyacid dehydrogenase family protein [Candidatus Caldatribacteriota bacterium]